MEGQFMSGRPMKPSAQKLSLFSAAYSANSGSVWVAVTTIIPLVKEVALWVLTWESAGSSTWQQVALQMS
jgi:hypothetical protein